MLPVPSKLTPRGLIAYSHDIFMVSISFTLSLYLRLGEMAFDFQELIITGTLIITPLSAVIFYYIGLYRGVWRYASIRDFFSITRAVSLLILIFAAGMFLATRLEDFPRTSLIINWFVLMALLGGPRFLYRIIKDRQVNFSRMTSDHQDIPSLIVGAGDHSELFLRTLNSNPNIPYVPVGILSEHKSRVGRDIHGIRVLGTITDMEKVLKDLEDDDNKPQHLILAKEEWEGAKVRDLLDLAEKFGIPLSRIPNVTNLRSGSPDKIEVRPVTLSDLLGRAQKALDKSQPQNLLKDKKVLITGAGGSIGSELVRQIAENQPAELILIEASEYALYTIDMEISRTFPDIKRVSLICNIRDNSRLNHVFETYAPEIVFHAAALKHVPLVEDNPIEGILTNAIGTKNVANACQTHKIQAMVQISTDKAVNPTNIMGATKRIAESYTQALDLDQNGCNYITVRFGNVLGSTGSVVPLFQKQLNEGGPLTVTHKDMTRFFMTVREAVELVLQSACLCANDHSLEGKICVLDMGTPVKILHLAEQVIKLSGLEPYKDIDIKITGLRPGEKLYEEIFHGDEPPIASSVEGILIATPRVRNSTDLTCILEKLETACRSQNLEEAIQTLMEIVPELDHQTHQT